jgi:hypothetical protein
MWDERNLPVQRARINARMKHEDSTADARECPDRNPKGADERAFRAAVARKDETGTLHFTANAMVTNAKFDLFREWPHLVDLVN